MYGMFVEMLIFLLVLFPCYIWWFSLATFYIVIGWWFNSLHNVHFGRIIDGEVRESYIIIWECWVFEFCDHWVFLIIVMSLYNMGCRLCQNIDVRNTMLGWYLAKARGYLVNAWGHLVNYWGYLVNAWGYLVNDWGYLVNDWGYLVKCMRVFSKLLRVLITEGI